MLTRDQVFTSCVCLQVSHHLLCSSWEKRRAHTIRGNTQRHQQPTKVIHRDITWCPLVTWCRLCLLRAVASSKTSWSSWSANRVTVCNSAGRRKNSDTLSSTNRDGPAGLHDNRHVERGVDLDLDLDQRWSQSPVTFPVHDIIYDITRLPADLKMGYFSLFICFWSRVGSRGRGHCSPGCGKAFWEMKSATELIPTIHCYMFTFVLINETFVRQLIWNKDVFLVLYRLFLFSHRRKWQTVSVRSHFASCYNLKVQLFYFDVFSK